MSPFLNFGVKPTYTLSKCPSEMRPSGDLLQLPPRFQIMPPQPLKE